MPALTRPGPPRPWPALVAVLLVLPMRGGCTHAPATPQALHVDSLGAGALAATRPGHPVRIVTDRYGIPHLLARDLDDLEFAWGWVTARDRLWQIEYSRRAARGELWQWLGNSKLRDDGGAQLFRLRTRAEQIWERERHEPEVNATLERYSAGINAYIAECRAGRHPWPVEFTRLHVTADDWRPEDTVMMLLAQGFVLDFDVPELEEARDVAEHGSQWIAARHRFEGPLTYRTIPDSAAERLFGAPARDDLEPRAHAAEPPPGAPHPSAPPAPDLPALARRSLGSWIAPTITDGDARASNVFAAGGRRSATGFPLLANDPHLALATPSPLHVIHVTVPGVVDAIGACVPGLPTIVSGRNARVAWGITALSADVIDVYADTLSRDGRSVRYGGSWVPIHEEPFTMRFRGGPWTFPLVGQKRRYTPHGPVLIYDRKRGVAYAARWACDDDSIRLDRLLGLERSASARELAERYRDQVTPGLNVIAADVTGRVIYQAVGSVPVRGFDPGYGPLPGDGRHEWRGTVPASRMPAWQAPPSGFVVNANNLPAEGRGLELWPRYDWANDRARRMAERLAGDPSLTLADMRSIQNDVVPLSARRMVPRLLRCADSLAGSLTPIERAALDTLRAWDFVARRNRVAPTIFRAWLGAFDRRSRLEGLQGLQAAALDGQAPEALRAPRSAATERPETAVVAALDTAVTVLERNLGPGIGRWTWGRGHRAWFRHRLPVRGFEPPPIPADGDNGTPCVGASQLPWSARFTHSAVFRHLVDLGSPDSSLGLVAPGNSGDLRSPHAFDQVVLWANHGYVPFYLDWKRIDAAKESEVTLGGGP